jgi:hypothetical protein
MGNMPGMDISVNVICFITAYSSFIIAIYEED